MVTRILPQKGRRRGVVIFRDKFASAANQNSSFLCIGLDPYDVPPELVAEFNRAIINATSDLVCAYKPNLAIYEGMGSVGMSALEETLEAIPNHIPVIGDGKRGDIENCGEAYATRLFGTYKFDAVTVNPYMASDAVRPFLDWKGKGVFVLCRTSNKHSGETQHLKVISEDGTIEPLYLAIARLAHSWDSDGSVGLVMGATYPEELALIRQLYPDVLLLIPGVGVQGGSLEEAVQKAADRSGGGFVLSVSRSIIYAHSATATNLKSHQIPHFADAARRSAIDYRRRINEARQPVLV